MTRYVALLRAIDVGGTGRLLMSDSKGKVAVTLKLDHS